MPSRSISLIVYHSPHFPAHWVVFVPNADGGTIGTNIHVIGDVRDGFTHQFTRGYNCSMTRRKHTTFTLGDVGLEYLVGAVSEAETGSDPNNELENVAISIPAPGKSLRSVDQSVGIVSLVGNIK